MQDSSPIVLRVHRLNTFTPDELEFIISHTKGTLTFEVLYPSIGSTQSYQVIASDLLDGLFIGETAAAFCKEVSFYGGWNEDEHCKTINFVVTPQNPTELAKKIHWLSYLFAEEGDDEKRIDLLDAISEFQDQLGLFEKKKYHFPLLLDDYFANYIIGLGEEGDIPEDVLEVDKDDTNQVIGYIYEKHGYIRSLSPHNLELEIYCSTENSTWIILSDALIDMAKLEQMFPIYRNSLLKPIELQDSSVIATPNFETLVFNQIKAVKYPFEQLIKAQQCVADILFIKNGIPIDPLNATRVRKNLLSKSGDILIVVDQMAQYIFFGDSLPTVPAGTLEEMAKSSPALKSYLDNL